MCPHSVKVFRVQGRHERHHALFCPRFFASLYRSRRQANKHTHVLNGNSTMSRANDAKVSINLLATLNVGGFHNATKWLAIQQLSQQFIALTETQLTKPTSTIPFDTGSKTTWFFLARALPPSTAPGLLFLSGSLPLGR